MHKTGTLLTLLLCWTLLPSAAQSPLAEETTEAPAWVRVTEAAAFSPRDTAEGVVFHGKLWLSNGYYHGNVLHRDLWNSEDGTTWKKVLDNTPYAGYSEWVVFQDRLWAIKESVWNSEDGLRWEKVLDETPFGVRGYGEAVVHAGRIWQLGSGADVWHTQNGKDWVCATPEAPYGKRTASAVAVFQDKLWLLGGRTDEKNTPPEKTYPDFTTHNDVWVSRDGVAWECLVENAPWSPRMWFAAEVYAGKLWILGGFDNAHGNNLGDVWYTEDGTHWTELKPQPSFTARHEPTVYVFQDTLWMVAGNTWPVVNDVWRLDMPGGEASK